ncbi:hypothetical protein EK21DRAFT_63572 [Setomelanomma holmii]|uniref:Uncharacterized protein n=1 Tax=Setomelanomma holmii TaxID=210430 RepID=A0A9P4HAX6_9PLEO|nr:hypothetical protein EK21DRAFT_63572 [Setomelanomma holmii]
MAGKKRTRNGQVKTANEAPVATEPPRDVSMTDTTPPCAQPQLPSSTSTKPSNATTNMPPPKRPTNDSSKLHNTTKAAENPDSKPKSKPRSNLHNTSKPNHQKLPKLPPNATISRRPLLHPALPNPFASSLSPKVLYIKASSPYIPAIKRVRRLLSEIRKREAQSSAALHKNARRKGGMVEASGRLSRADVERGIVEGKEGGVNSKGIDGEGENVYLKATGRAILRALEVGVAFQGEADCVVRVEMGSVRAIDDIGFRNTTGEAGEEGVEEAEEVPETRIRTISSVTVSIGLE